MYLKHQASYLISIFVLVMAAEELKVAQRTGSPGSSQVAPKWRFGPSSPVKKTLRAFRSVTQLLNHQPPSSLLGKEVNSFQSIRHFDM